MRNFCNSCGISIPDGQSFCSMCYGDPAYGRDGEAKNRSFKEFVVQALNEKWERDFGEPLRWRYAHIDMLCGRLVCPKCDRTVLIFNDYCPHCGQRLLPPEEALDGRKDKAL